MIAFDARSRLSRLQAGAAERRRGRAGRAVTERAAHRIVGDVADAGYVSRERHRRRNRYTINSSLTLPDPVARHQRVGDLLALLTESSSAPPALDSAPAAT
jgi:hypothetical protein